MSMIGSPRSSVSVKSSASVNQADYDFIDAAQTPALCTPTTPAAAASLGCAASQPTGQASQGFGLRVGWAAVTRTRLRLGHGEHYLASQRQGRKFLIRALRLRFHIAAAG
eukprot:3844993-Rhodomonas_salina.2